MRAADDFAVIRARMRQLEREREWAAHDREAQIHELDRMDFRVVQRMKAESARKPISVVYGRRR